MIREFSTARQIPVESNPTARTARVTTDRSQRVLSLQRSMGNRAVQRLLDARMPPTVQRDFVERVEKGPLRPEFIVDFSEYLPSMTPDIPLTSEQQKRKLIADHFHWIGKLLAHQGSYNKSLVGLDAAVQEKLEDLLDPANQPNKPPTPTKALNLVLQEKEASLGLTTIGKPTLTGFVEGADFSKVIMGGSVFKDVGADSEHGEFTHRIQWYIIADNWANEDRPVPADPANAGVTMLDVYKASGDSSFFAGTALENPGKLTGVRTPWDFIVDAQRGVYQTKEKGLASNPEALNALLTKDSDMAAEFFAERLVDGRTVDDRTRPGLPEALKQRRAKRENEESLTEDYSERKKAVNPGLVQVGATELGDGPIFYKSQQDFENSPFAEN